MAVTGYEEKILPLRFGFSGDQVGTRCLDQNSTNVDVDRLVDTLLLFPNSDRCDFTLNSSVLGIGQPFIKLNQPYSRVSQVWTSHCHFKIFPVQQSWRGLNSTEYVACELLLYLVN